MAENVRTCQVCKIEMTPQTHPEGTYSSWKPGPGHPPAFCEDHRPQDEAFPLWILWDEEVPCHDD